MSTATPAAGRAPPGRADASSGVTDAAGPPSASPPTPSCTLERRRRPRTLPAGRPTTLTLTVVPPPTASATCTSSPRQMASTSVDSIPVQVGEARAALPRRGRAASRPPSGDKILSHAGEIGRRSWAPCATAQPRAIISRLCLYLRPSEVCFGRSAELYQPSFARLHTGAKRCRQLKWQRREVLEKTNESEQLPRVAGPQGGDDASLHR